MKGECLHRDWDPAMYNLIDKHSKYKDSKIL